MVHQIFSHVFLHILRHFLFTQGIQGFQGCRVPARSSRLRPSRWGKWIGTGPLFREPSEVLTGMLCFFVRNLVCLCILFAYYMVIDLKVLVKSFNCEDRSCYAGNPRVFFFAIFFIRQSFAKVGYYESYYSYLQLAKCHCLEAHRCTCRWYCLTLLSESQETSSKCSSQASKSEACTPRPLMFAFPLMRPLLMAVCG